MADNNIPSLGRFSSQMLTYLGTQRYVSTGASGSYNTFKYNTKPSVYVDPDSKKLSRIGAGVPGQTTGNIFDRTKAYFKSRGASEVYADSMALLVIDTAQILGVTPLSLIERSERDRRFLLSNNAMTAFNTLRDPGHQVSSTSETQNRQSFKATQIRG